MAPPVYPRGGFTGSRSPHDLYGDDQELEDVRYTMERRWNKSGLQKGDVEETERMLRWFHALTRRYGLSSDGALDARTSSPPDASKWWGCFRTGVPFACAAHFHSIANGEESQWRVYANPMRLDQLRHNAKTAFKMLDEAGVVVLWTWQDFVRYPEWDTEMLFRQAHAVWLQLSCEPESARRTSNLGGLFVAVGQPGCGEVAWLQPEEGMADPYPCVSVSLDLLDLLDDGGSGDDAVPPGGARQQSTASVSPPPTRIPPPPSRRSDGSRGVVLVDLSDVPVGRAGMLRAAPSCWCGGTKELGTVATLLKTHELEARLRTGVQSGAGSAPGEIEWLEMEVQRAEVALQQLSSVGRYSNPASPHQSHRAASHGGSPRSARGGAGGRATSPRVARSGGGVGCSPFDLEEEMTLSTCGGRGADDTARDGSFEDGETSVVGGLSSSWSSSSSSIMEAGGGVNRELEASQIINLSSEEDDDDDERRAGYGGHHHHHHHHERHAGYGGQRHSQYDASASDRVRGGRREGALSLEDAFETVVARGGDEGILLGLLLCYRQGAGGWSGEALLERIKACFKGGEERRACALLLAWLREFYADYDDAHLCDSLQSFLFPYPGQGLDWGGLESLRDALDRYALDRSALMGRRTAYLSTAKGALLGAGGEVQAVEPGGQHPLVSMQAMQVASYLTLLESALLLSVPYSDFVHPRPRLAHGVAALLESSRRTTQWVEDAITSAPSSKRAAGLICHFLDIADGCRQLGNMPSTMAIWKGLQSARVCSLSDANARSLGKPRTLAVYAVIGQLHASLATNGDGEGWGGEGPFIPCIEPCLQALEKAQGRRQLFRAGDGGGAGARRATIDLDVAKDIAAAALPISRHQHWTYAVQFPAHIACYLRSALAHDLFAASPGDARLPTVRGDQSAGVSLTVW